ncbi:MAG: pyridoxal 5'-phosphate synthase glutaminase subunit PdxT, partial [Niameybacter sp.]
MKIGVLGLQGSVEEHFKSLEKCGVKPVLVKYPSDLSDIDGIILPGGESTTLGKLLHKQGLHEPLKSSIENGMPVYGTCAGMILLAKEIDQEEAQHLATMDIVVKRNAYGSQVDSFISKENIDFISGDKKVELVFIRAPKIQAHSDDVVVWKLNEDIVLARQKNMMVTSFHPELTDDITIHKYFIDEI